MKYFYDGAWHEISYKVSDTLPIGALIAFGGSEPPEGWLMCNGANVSRTQYAALFAVIGTHFGEGDGTNTFTLPDLQGKNPIGASSKYNLGDTGGEEEHVLLLSEIPYHQHAIYGNDNLRNSDTGSAWANQGITADAFKNLSGGAGGSLAHNNMQPYQVTNYIIKAYQTVANVAKVVSEKSANTNDTYSCQYINNLHKYSSAEHLSGDIWINNKPIYRQVITVEHLPNTSDLKVYYDINGLDEFISIGGVAKYHVGNQYYTLPLNNSRPDDNARTIGIWHENDYLIIRTKADRSDYSAYIIIEYTKQ